MSENRKTVCSGMEKCGMTREVLVDRELDIMDCFFEWLLHWKTILLFLLVGAILAGGYLGYRTLSVPKGGSLAKTAGSASKLSAAQRRQIEAAAGDYLRMLQLSEEGKSGEEELTASEEIQLLSNAVTARYYLFSLKKVLDSNEYMYFCDLLETSPDGGAVKASSGLSKSDYLIAAMLAGGLVVLHFCAVIWACFHSRVLRRTDDIAALLECRELFRTIEWNAIARRNALDRLVLKLRYRKAAKDDSGIIEKKNARYILQLISENNDNSVCLISGCEELSNRMRQALESANPGVRVSCIASLSEIEFDKERLGDEISCCVLLARADQSSIDELREECQAMKRQNIENIGIVVYELL